MLTPGIRVIRGFDWAWGDQDGGAGSVGTVCEIGMPGSKKSPDKTVVVNWDCGIRSNYRVGYQGLYDLIILDNAQCGVKHPNVECDLCKQNGIVGIRYKCTVCNNCNLCSLCYHDNKHSLDHEFIRYSTAVSPGVLLTPRSVESKLCVRGIFSGAIVQRGHDWKWDMQDGGEGKTGYVTEICNWGTESQRSVACVTWHTGYKNDYRVGHKGIMDLKYAKPAIGGYYYIKHLPILGKKEECPSQANEIGQSEQASVSVKLHPGERVKVLLDVETLKSLQQGHGGWNSRMVEYIGKVGVVHRTTERGDIRVQYDGCTNRWTFHPGALERLSGPRLGDFVQISKDLQLVQMLQRQHAEWLPSMEEVLGKVGKVTNVFQNGNIYVQICEGEHESTWTIHPQCVKTSKSLETPVLSSEGSGSKNESQTTVEDNAELKLLMSKVAQGNLEYVKEIREKCPVLLDGVFYGKTALQVAAHQGHALIVNELLAAGAKPTLRDLDGDTALHDAAFGNQPEILEILLNSSDVDINMPNRSGCTVLHIVAHKCFPHCVGTLLRYNPNVNAQDTYGDTALHDAINCGVMGNEKSTCQLIDTPVNVPVVSSHQIIQMLAEHPDMDFSITNKRGFNVLQHAALKGNAFACEIICRRAPHLVNAVKDDGFSALHLAALNGHKNAVFTLVLTGGANLNLRNNRQQTPLLLAISQGHTSVIELLVNIKCDLTAVDEDGNSALHILAIKRLNIQPNAARHNLTEAPVIKKIYEKLLSDKNIMINGLACAIALFLISKGCEYTIVNKDNKTFFDLLDREPYTLQVLTDGIKSIYDVISNSSNSMPQLENPMAEIRLAEGRQNNLRPNSTRGLIFSGPGDSSNNSPLKTDHNYSDNTESSGQSKTVECIVCCEFTSGNCLFEPCGHSIACEDCAIRMKKCLSCGVVVERRTTIDGRCIDRGRKPSTDRLQYLECKLQELEETQSCSICMERRRSIAFLCGHQACSTCAATLTTCHMCRQPLTTKIHLY